jgi:hypothetical protein
VLKPSYDIWACGMTLLAAADVTEVDSSLKEPKLFNVSDDGDGNHQVLRRTPNWMRIQTSKVMQPHKTLFELIFEVEEKRITAEDLIACFY